MPSYGEGTEGLPEEVLKAAKLTEGDLVQFWQTATEDSAADIDKAIAVSECVDNILCGPFLVVCHCCMASDQHARAEQMKKKYWLVTTENFVEVYLDTPTCSFPAFNCCCITGGFVVGATLSSSGVDKKKTKLEMVIEADEDNKGKNCCQSCIPSLNSQYVMSPNVGALLERKRILTTRSIMLGADNDFNFPDKIMKAKQTRMLQLQSMGAAAATQGMMNMGTGLPAAGGMAAAPMNMQQMQQQQMMMQQMQMQQMQMQQPQMAMMGGQPVMPVMGATTSVVPGGGAPVAQDMEH